jgi:hypothetical protein
MCPCVCVFSLSIFSAVIDLLDVITLFLQSAVPSPLHIFVSPLLKA